MIKMRTETFDDEPWPFPCLVIEAQNEDDALQQLLEHTKNLLELFKNHDDIHDDEPWFGWVFELPRGVVSERAFMNEAGKNPEMQPLIATYVERVRDYFKATEGEPGFYVHEEKEAGADGIMSLMLNAPQQFLALYISYLNEMDFTHSVALGDHMRQLKKKLAPNDWALVRKALDDVKAEGINQVLEFL